MATFLEFKRGESFGECLCMVVGFFVIPDGVLGFEPDGVACLIELELCIE